MAANKTKHLDFTMKEHFFQTEYQIRQGRKWIKALRSGEFKQTKGILHDIDGFCCLGVACKVLIPEHKQKMRIENGKKYLAGAIPSHERQPNAPKWLTRISPYFLNNYFLNGNLRSLTALNDDAKFTFPQIADAVEKMFPQLIIKKPGKKKGLI